MQWSSALKDVNLEAKDEEEGFNDSVQGGRLDHSVQSMVQIGNQC
jgi:hypothetical protein